GLEEGLDFGDEFVFRHAGFRRFDEMPVTGIGEPRCLADVFDFFTRFEAAQVLEGVNIPGSIGRDTRIDAERLAPFYARVEQLGVPIFLHPTDAVFGEDLEGYGGALQLSLGRIIEVSVAASRLIFSGLMERHPGLKIVMSHTGGALPYQSGRMDKNGKNARLPRPPSTYIRHMHTDTVSPHSMGIKFAIEYYGIDRVMYGSDYQCWDPATALALIQEIGLSDADLDKLLYGNAHHILGLADFPKRGIPESAPVSIAQTLVRNDGERIPLLTEEGRRDSLIEAGAPGAKREPDRAKPQLWSVRPRRFAVLTTPSAPPARWLSAHPPLLCEEGNACPSSA